MTRGESQGPRRGGRAPRGSSAPIPSFLGPLDFPLALPCSPAIHQAILISKPAKNEITMDPNVFPALFGQKTRNKLG